MKVTLARKGGRLVRTLAAAPEVNPDYASAPDAETGVEEEIARVAETHQPDGGYGETSWNAETKTVYWVPADWSTTEEVDAAHADFLAIDGVDSVEGDAESALPVDEGWTRVWPEPREGEAATAAERWEKLIGELEADGTLDPEPAPVTAAIETAVVDLPSRRRRGRKKSDAILASAMSAITELARAAALDDEDDEREEPQQIHVHFAAPSVTMNAPPAPNVNVHVPEMRAPDVHLNVEAPRAPNVEVNVPEQKAPDVHVSVPEVRAPDVHVQVASPDVHVAAPEVRYEAPDIHVTVEPPRPSAVRLEIDEDGTRRFVPEEQEEQDEADR